MSRKQWFTLLFYIQTLSTKTRWISKKGITIPYKNPMTRCTIFSKALFESENCATKQPRCCIVCFPSFRYTLASVRKIHNWLLRHLEYCEARSQTRFHGLKLGLVLVNISVIRILQPPKPNPRNLRITDPQCPGAASRPVGLSKTEFPPPSATQLAHPWLGSITQWRNNVPASQS